jgi:hypothetical protein
MIPRTAALRNTIERPAIPDLVLTLRGQIRLPGWGVCHFFLQFYVMNDVMREFDVVLRGFCAVKVCILHAYRMGLESYLSPYLSV